MTHGLGSSPGHRAAVQSIGMKSGIATHGNFAGSWSQELAPFAVAQVAFFPGVPQFAFRLSDTARGQVSSPAGCATSTAAPATRGPPGESAGTGPALPRRPAAGSRPPTSPAHCRRLGNENSASTAIVNALQTICFVADGPHAPGTAPAPAPRSVSWARSQATPAPGPAAVGDAACHSRFPP